MAAWCSTNRAGCSRPSCIARSAVWPPPEAQDKPTLPTSLRLTLSQPGQEPLQTEVLIQTATGIPCPIERRESAPAAETPEPPPAALPVEP